MSTFWRGLAFGILLGVVVSFAIGYNMGKRYVIYSTGLQGVWAIKLDTWTGRSWMERYYPSPTNADVKVFYWEELHER